MKRQDISCLFYCGKGASCMDKFYLMYPITCNSEANVEGKIGSAKKTCFIKNKASSSIGNVLKKE